MEIPSLPAARFDVLIGSERGAEFRAALDRFRADLGGRSVWCVNSTSEGGGVAEILSSALCYLAGADIPIRWLVIDGTDEFFQVTKGLHHLLHGASPRDFQAGDHERATYESSLQSERHSDARRT
jgi:trehalose synthase